MNLGYRYLFKRTCDLVIGSLIFVASLPLACAVILLTFVDLGCPVFFIQNRPGQHGRTFSLIKFRTMTGEVDSKGQFLSDEQRITVLGRLLRSFSLDELPTLFNVLKGDMSLVGPRPLLSEYLGLYSRDQMRRHDVKPGLTGWAQVNGRNAITWEDKFKHDVWYVDNWSLSLDLKILAMTLARVIRREGINQPGHATMERFRGTMVGRCRIGSESQSVILAQKWNPR